MDEENYWMSLSDLMSGLMVIFFLGLAYMVLHYKTILNLEKGANQEITRNTLLFQELLEECQNTYCKDIQFTKVGVGSFRLRQKIYFNWGEHEINTSHEKTLRPIIQLIESMIEKHNTHYYIVIEGYASRGCKNTETEIDAYLCNIKIGSHRSQNVLKYIMHNIENKEEAYNYFISTSFSSSISTSNTKENQRVEILIKHRIINQKDHL